MLKKIYVMGDGAYWIKTGLEVLGAKSIFVLDKFHLSQSITRATAHLGDSVFDARFKIYDGNVYDLMAYQKEKKERKIEEHIREGVDQKIRKERHKYCNAFEHTTIALNNGKRTGLHMITKALRGICG